MIGDSETDARTAANAGAPFLLHLGGYNHVPPETLGAFATFSDWREAPALIEAALARA